MTHDGFRTWLITGASRGLGRAFAEAALRAGEIVVATARDVGTVKDLVDEYGERAVSLPLDVRDSSAVFATVAAARERVGRIDVLVNNAGYGLAGAVEEVTERQARDEFDVNFFGALWCTQAVLPVMRAQGGGHIFQISSIAGVAGYPNLGLYVASKWALEGLGEALAQEVAAFGIGVTIVEPGEFRTDWSAGSLVRASPMLEYDPVLAKRRHGLSGAFAAVQPGDPRKAGEALLAVLAADHRPLRLLLGRGAADLAPAIYQRRLEEWAAWATVARGADFTD